MSLVFVDRDGETAIVSIDNPPVNALSHKLREALLAATADAIADRSIAQIVIIGAGRMFSAGADIDEFDEAPRLPDLPTIVETIAASPKPVIAAIHGHALGGGLEIALGCHCRIASSDTVFALPETSIGLIPGAGGTQRLPRLIPLKDAIEIILAGKRIDATRALTLGLIDAIAEGSFKVAALKFAENLDRTKVMAQRGLRAKLEAGELTPIAAARETARQRHRGQTAPHAALDAIETGCQLPLEAGLRVERELFLSLRTSAQARALRHIAKAERQTGRVDQTDPSCREIESIAVIGGGQMGVGIALACLQGGFVVTLIEQDDAQSAVASARMDGFLSDSVRRGTLTHAESDALRSRLRFSAQFADVGPAGLVIEAVFEDLELKASVFARLGALAAPGAILASNTSYLDIDALSKASGRPADVIGLHFFAPAHVMRLIEIVSTPASGKDALATAAHFAKRLKKIPVFAQNAFGFIGNRLYQHYQREAGHLILEGAEPQQVDDALKAYGLAMGPFAAADLSGLDIGHAMRRKADPDRIAFSAFRVHDRLVAAGHLGRKSGAGFYDYGAGAVRANAAALDIIESARAEAKIAARAISDQEIVSRCLDTLVLAGADAIEDGIARSASDIDVVFVNGYGFPRWRGGPMHACEATGLDQALDRIKAHAQRAGPRWWTPPPLLLRAAQSGVWASAAAARA